MKRTQGILVFILLGVLVLEYAEADANNGLVFQYGESCDEKRNGILCNREETLACINGTCNCANPYWMTFDPSKNLCVGLAGTPCVNHLAEEDVVHYKRSQCVIYSQCDNTNKCKCWSGYYPDENGHCIRKLGYMSSCSSSIQCDNRSGFSCVNGFCSCDNITGIYIPKKGKCVGLPGEKCLNSQRECTPRFQCRMGICKCKYKETESMDGLTSLCEPIKHKYGRKCGRFRSCGHEGTGLVCSDGKCRCRNPDYQVYDYDKRSCMSLIGGPCTLPQFNRSKANAKFDPEESFPTVPCVPYAQCVKRKENRFRVGKMIPEGRCECKDGFQETIKGRCALGFGAVCDRRSSKYDECDPTVPLYCVQGKCGCKNELDVFENQVKRCRRAVGSVCYKSNDCVANSQCRIKSNGVPGRCLCNLRFEATARGTCI